MKETKQFLAMKAGQPFEYDDCIVKIQNVCLKKLKKMDNLPLGSGKRQKICKSLFKKFGKNNLIKYGFKCDLGINISIGDDCLFNYDVAILDDFDVEIGSRVLIAPKVLISAAGHSLDIKERTKVFCKKVVIEDDVWIGAGAIILPGVTLGKGSVIAAGAVVKEDVPPFCVVAGVPAKVVKHIEQH